MAQEAQVQAFLQAFDFCSARFDSRGPRSGEMGPFRLVRPPQHHLCVLPLIKGCVHVSERRRSSSKLSWRLSAPGARRRWHPDRAPILARDLAAAGIFVVSGARPGSSSRAGSLAVSRKETQGPRSHAGLAQPCGSALPLLSLHAFPVWSRCGRGDCTGLPPSGTISKGEGRREARIPRTRCHSSRAPCRFIIVDREAVSR
jgi:hypothetical protein